MDPQGPSSGLASAPKRSPEQEHWCTLRTANGFRMEVKHLQIEVQLHTTQLERVHVNSDIQGWCQNVHQKTFSYHMFHLLWTLCLLFWSSPAELFCRGMRDTQSWDAGSWRALSTDQAWVFPLCWSEVLCQGIQKPSQQPPLSSSCCQSLRRVPKRDAKWITDENIYLFLTGNISPCTRLVDWHIPI